MPAKKAPETGKPSDNPSDGENMTSMGRVAFFSGNEDRDDAVAGQLIIVCRQPGLRRAGIEHPAVAVYAPEYFTSDQVKSLKAEPLLEVLGVL